MISIVHLVVHLVTLNIVIFERLSKFIIIGNKIVRPHRYK